MSAKTSDHLFLLRWYLAPALFWLVVVTVSGSLIRFLWAYPGVLSADAKFLTHAHSHVALLGWAWMVAVVYLIRIHLPELLQHKPLLRGYALLVHGSVLGMFITFSIGGYWKWSIIFSAMHVLLSSAFSLIYLMKRRSVPDRPSSIAFDSAILLGFVANLAPLALALGSRVGANGVTVIVNGYVHLQCFGFLGLFLAGMAYDSVLRRPMLNRARWHRSIVSLMVIAVIPAQLLAVAHLLPGKIPIWAGSIGMGMFALSLWGILIALWQRRALMRRAGCFRAVSVAAFGLLILAGLLTLTAIPPVSAPFIHSRYMMIGVIHLLLLGMVTPVFLFYIHREVGLRLVSIRIPVLLFVAGTWVMLALLFLGGWAQSLLMILPFNIAMGLFHIAVPVAAAAIWLFGLVVKEGVVLFVCTE